MATDIKPEMVVQPADVLAKANLVRAHNTLHGFEVLDMNSDLRELVVALVWRWVTVADEEMREYHPHTKVPCASEFRHGESEICQRELNEAMGLPVGTVRADNWIGHDYITIPMHLRARIPELVDKARTLNYSLSLKTALRSRYRPGGPPFGIDNSERLALDDFHENMRMSADAFLLFSQKDLLCDPHLWSTAAGKQFAHELQNKYRTHPRRDFVYKEEPLYLADGGADGMPNALIDYPLAVPVVAAPPVPPLSPIPQSLVPVPPPPPIPVQQQQQQQQHQEAATVNGKPTHKREAESETDTTNSKYARIVIPDDSSSSSSSEENICMICLAAAPNTLVLPCQHRVVCRTCSEGLRATPDNRVCVRCRRPITNVIWDGGEEHKA
jgi:hypothetical protein